MTSTNSHKSDSNLFLIDHEDHEFPQSCSDRTNTQDDDHQNPVTHLLQEMDTREEVWTEETRTSARRRRVSESDKEHTDYNCKKSRTRNSASGNDLDYYRRPSTSSSGPEHMERLGRLSKVPTSRLAQQRYLEILGERMEDKGSDHQLWHIQDRLASCRSSCGSSDNDELEDVREVLRQRRLSRQAPLLNQSSSGETYPGLKVLKLAVQEHELPMRMAYKQLDELAANAERVKSSIERNRSLLLLQEGCQLVKAKKYHQSYISQSMSMKKVSRIFICWKQRKELHLFYRRAVRKLENRHLGTCFRAWRDKAFYVENCVRKILRLRLALVFAAWLERLENAQRKKDVISKMKRKRMVWFFYGFVEGCNEQKWRRRFKAKVVKKALGQKLKMAFQAWLYFLQNFIHHNKMLIKGASSFNTVVRALKNDALKRGVHPEFLYAMDRLAMDQVCIFPDGEMRVKTLSSFDKGKWVPQNSNSSIHYMPNVRTSDGLSLSTSKASSCQPVSPTQYSNSPNPQENLDKTPKIEDPDLHNMSLNG